VRTASTQKDNPVAFFPHILPTPPADALPSGAVLAERLLPQDVPLALGHGAVLIDIRAQSTRSSQGVLAGALAIDPFVLAARCAPGGEHSLCRAADSAVWWVVVSATGQSSLRAARRLRAAGLDRVSDVVGGFAALREARMALSASSVSHAKREQSTFAAHL
jgi:rhodanese-related sulfurtransferase